MMDGTPPPVHHTQPIDLPDEWDEPTAEWVATLRDDSGDTIALRPVWDPPDPATGGDGPHTTSELVLMPGYTQSAWDRRQVRQLQAADDGEQYLWNNLHKTDEVLVRDLLLMLGYPRAAHAHMAGGFVTGEIYGALAAPPKPKRVRPSRARKAATGGAA